MVLASIRRVKQNADLDGLITEINLSGWDIPLKILGVTLFMQIALILIYYFVIYLPPNLLRKWRGYIEQNKQYRNEELETKC